MGYAAMDDDGSALLDYSANSYMDEDPIQIYCRFGSVWYNCE